MLDVLILAAGKGTRMKSDLPKVLQPIAGKPMLIHVIDTAEELSPNMLCVVVGHGAKQVQTVLNDSKPSQTDVRESAQIIDDLGIVIVEQKQQLGTGHAVTQALPALNKNTTVLILYGDVPLLKPETLKELVGLVTDTSLALLTVELPDPSGYGRILRDETHQVIKIVEQKDAHPDELAITEVNTGIIAVKSAHLDRWLPKLTNNNAQKEYYLTDIIAMAKSDSVDIKTVQPQQAHEVMGINNRIQQAELERIYQRDFANYLMQEGLTLKDPNRFDCRGKLKAGRDCVVDINCVFEGEVELGNHVIIGTNCTIKNAKIGDYTEVASNSVIEDSIVESHCNIGPFARLRPGTHLKQKAKIGNFVETKKALVGKGSKINHLSYVGDAVLGDNVNVGAGTITCNYDGVNKSQTLIGDNVFVGSNSALVAPVSVASGATVGAGSTITKNVEEDQLAVARSRQSNLNGWDRPTKKAKK